MRGGNETNTSTLDVPTGAELISILDTMVKFVEKQGADQVEAYGEISRIIQVGLEKNDLHTSNDGVIGGIGVRVFKNNAVGFACGNIIDEEEGKEIGLKAYKLSKKLQTKPYNYLPNYNISNSEVNKKIPGIYHSPSCNFSTEEMLKNVVVLLKTIKNADPRIMIDSGSFSGSYGTRALVNSNGIAVSECANAFVWYVVGMARETDEVGTLSFEYDYAIKRNDITVEKTAQRFIKKTLSTLGAKKLDNSFKGDIILTPRAVSELLLPVIMFNVSAKSVQKKYSAFIDKIGQKIASSSLTVIDDGTKPKKLSSGAFDREGIPHQPLTILKKGILKSYLYDTTAANRDGTSSTGHGCGSWNTKPNIGSTNIFIESGSWHLDNMIQDIKHGLIIDAINGDPDPISGDASVRIKSANLIQKGEKHHPVREATLNVNVFNLLNKISAIGKEQKELFSFNLPAIRINDVPIIT